MKLNTKVLGHPYTVRSCLWFFSLVLCCHICQSMKIRYASSKECDRYSLDAVYHDKYKPITHNIFADTKEFMSRVSDLTADSLTAIMAALPDRDVSNNEEKRIYGQFKNVKSTLASKIKKLHRNITTSWEHLIVSHFDLMFDNSNSSLADYVNKTARMTDSYSSARKTLDDILSAFIKFIKSTVQDGIVGIKAASEDAIKKEEKEREKNKTAEGTKDSNQKGKSKEDILREKMVEISKDIVPGFLGNLNVQVIERKLDSAKRPDIDPESRDSVLDDILFDMLMLKNRVGAIVQLDVPKDKGAVDLARRSIYTYWADMADEMYKEKMKSKKSEEGSDSGRLFYKNMWKNEEQLMGTLLSLMEVYP